MLWLSLGENCLTDELLRRHGKKSFSTPYSHGRSNIDYALQLEMYGYDILLDNRLLEVADAFGDRVIRSKYITQSSPIFDSSHRMGFEMTHHDVIENADHRGSFLRKIERMKSIRGREDVVFFYHHRVCSSTNLEILRRKLIDFKNIFSTKDTKCFVVLFYQTISNHDARRVIVSEKYNGLIECEFFTEERWAGRDPKIFWAQLDDDLIGEMMSSVQGLICEDNMPKAAASCNICGSDVFIDFNFRAGVQCSACNSLERHRLVRWTLERLGYVSSVNSIKRALHLAPEEMTHRYLAQSFGSGYVCSDLVPSKYPHAECLKLALPEGFDIFPDCYFDLILHNHVLEHIPGDYRDHLAQFVRMLRPGGHMVFTLPGISKTATTVQGGEYLPSDEERLRLHGQSDHYKSFGYDLIEWFNSAKGRFSPMFIPDDVRAVLRAPTDVIFVFVKV